MEQLHPVDDAHEAKQEKFLFLTPDDAEFLESCGTTWGCADSAATMREKGICILVGVIEVPEC